MIASTEGFVEGETLPPQLMKHQTEKRITTELDTCLQDICFSVPGSEGLEISSRRT
jgi:hypothetical protein